MSAEEYQQALAFAKRYEKRHRSMKNWSADAHLREAESFLIAADKLHEEDPPTDFYEKRIRSYALLASAHAAVAKVKVS